MTDDKLVSDIQLELEADKIALRLLKDYVADLYQEGDEYPEEVSRRFLKDMARELVKARNGEPQLVSEEEIVAIARTIQKTWTTDDIPQGIGADSCIIGAVLGFKKAQSMRATMELAKLMPSEKAYFNAYYAEKKLTEQENDDDDEVDMSTWSYRWLKEKLGVQ